VLFGLRFDFRNPDHAETTMADRYAAALDMAEWADRLGCVTIAVSEHHGSPDGYLPSPIPMLAAMAARTTSVRLNIAALIAPFHDPLHLAEELIVLDILTRGRVDLIIAGGYVHEEFAMFDVPMNERGARVTEMVRVLNAAFSGQPFDYRPAAVRAARIADGFVPSVPEVWTYYRDEVLALGRPDPGNCPVGPNQVVALAEDPDTGWELMAPFFLHETNAYGAWQAQDDVASPFHTVTDADELRTTGQYRVVSPEQFVEEQKASPFPFAFFHPLCGGMPVDLAWSSLRLFEDEVLPAFR
jgi:hypothetical protein